MPLAIVLAIVLAGAGAGCIQVSRGTINTRSASMIGIDIAGPDSTVSPHIRIGFIRIQAHSIPVSTNAAHLVHAPNFESFIQLRSNSSTTITEDVRTGECALVPAPVPFNTNNPPTQ